MKKYLQTFSGIIFAIILTLSLFPMEVKAEVQTSGEWQYEDRGDGVYITKYTGESRGVVIPDKLDGLSITAIGAEAFRGNATLTSITIPESIRYIGNCAFKDCTALKEIYFNAKNATVDGIGYYVGGVFSGAGSAVDGLKVVFGSEVTTVPNQLFNTNPDRGYDYAHVTEVVFPVSVKTIGEYAFHQCKDLKTVTFGENVETISKGAFGNCDVLEQVTFNDKLYTIEEDAFYSCDSLKTITTGNNLDIIGNKAFAECKSLEKANFSKVGTIGVQAFYNCSSLTEVTIPAGATYIGNEAFKSTTKLSLINFNARNLSVESIGYYVGGVFSGAGSAVDNLKVVIGNDVTTVPNQLFNTNPDRGHDYAHITEVQFSDNVKTIGEYSFYLCKDLEKITFGTNVETVGKGAFGNNESLEQVTFNDKMNTIGEDAFYSCDSLKTITTGNNLDIIGNRAFAECKSLEKANLSKAGTIGAQAFYNCTSLTEITIPEGTTYIGNEAYKSTPKLSLINFNARNASVESIGYYVGGVFSGAGSAVDNLKVVIGNDVTMVPNQLFNTNPDRGHDYAHITEVQFSDNVKTIGEYSFYLCKDLEKITFGTNVETIGKGAFGNNESLEQVTFNDKMDTIGEDAFYSCDSLKTITTGNYLATIGYRAFAECKSLEKANLSKAGTIGAQAFFNCTSLTEITIPEGTTYIGNEAYKSTPKLALINYNAVNAGVDELGYYVGGVFSGAGSNSNTLKVVFGNKVTNIPNQLFAANLGRGHDYVHISEVVFSDSVKKIGDDAFSNCYDLKSVTLGNNVDTVGNYAFNECSELTKVVFNNALTSIGNGAFKNCKKLADVTWGTNITTIGEYAFENCSSLTTLNFNNKLSKIFAGAFQNCTSVQTITIPESVIEIHNQAFCGTSSLNKLNFNAKTCAVSGVGYYNKGVFAGAGINANKFEVIFGNSITEIPAQLFNSKDKAYARITNVTVPANVTKVGDYAFAACVDLEKITFYAPAVTVGEEIFKDSNSSAVVECYYGSGLKEAAEASGVKYSYITPAQPAVSKVVNGSKGVNITWKKVIGAEGYIILRKTGNGAYAQVGKVATGVSSYTDTSASSGKTYTYTVQAYAGSKKSTTDKSSQTIKYLKTVTISSVANGSSKITLKWKKVSGAKQYKIYRSKDGGKYALLKTVKTTSYTDKKSIKNGSKYSYKIVATDNKYSSADSSVSTIYYLAKTSFTSKKSSAKGVLNLKWKKNSKASGYQIMYSTSSKLKSPKYVKVSGSKKLSATIKKLKSKKNYYICIRTYKTVKGKTYYSEWSTKQKIKIK